MGIYETKKWWQNRLAPVVAASVNMGIQPDFYSFAGILCSFLAGIFLYQAKDSPAWLWPVPGFICFRLLFNLMDGLVARQMQVADKLGELKNEFGDRISDFFIYSGLAFCGYANPRFVFVVFSLILFISYLGILSKAITGQRIYLGIFGKGDRMLSLAAFCFYPLFTGNLKSFDVYLAFSCLAALITILQRLRAIRHVAKSTP